MNTKFRINPPIRAKELRASLSMVIAAICFGTVFFSVTQGTALTGFARQMGASDFVFSLLMAMPVIAGVFQVIGSYLLERGGSRRRLFLRSLYPQRLIWIPVALVPLLIKNENLRISAVILLVFAANACGSIGGVAFMSWMSDLVPAEIRGRFFGVRSALSTAVGVVSAWVVGKFLDQHTDFTGYAIVFIIAALFGAADIAFFHFVKEPPMNRSTGPLRFSQIITEPLRSKRFTRFLLFWCCTMFSYLLIGSFAQVYLLESLSLRISVVSFYTQVVPNMAIFLAASLWGIMIDRFGCKPVIWIALAVQSAVPFLWFFTTADRWWLLVSINFITGFFWSAFDMVAINLLMRTSPDRNRSAYIANYALITGIFGNAAAYISAGAFLWFIHPLVELLDLTILGSKVTRFHFLFLLSGILRVATLVFVHPIIDEPGASSVGEMLKSIFRHKGRRRTPPPPQQVATVEIKG